MASRTFGDFVTLAGHPSESFLDSGSIFMIDDRLALDAIEADAPFQLRRIRKARTSRQYVGRVLA
jgi:hypothetical protein